MIRVACSDTRLIWVSGTIIESPYTAEVVQFLSYLHFLLQTLSLAPVKTSGGLQSAAVILGCALCSVYFNMNHTCLFVLKVKVIKDV